MLFDDNNDYVDDNLLWKQKWKLSETKKKNLGNGNKKNNVRKRNKNKSERNEHKENAKRIECYLAANCRINYCLPIDVFAAHHHFILVFHFLFSNDNIISSKNLTTLN